MKFAPMFRNGIESGEKTLTTRLHVPGLNFKSGQVISLDFQDGLPEVEAAIKRVSRPWRAIGVWFDKRYGKKESRVLGRTYYQIAVNEGFEYYKDFAWFLSCTYCRPEKGEKYIRHDAGTELKFITYEFEVVKS